MGKLVIINNGNDEWWCHKEEAGLPLGNPKQPAGNKACPDSEGIFTDETTLTFQTKTGSSPGFRGVSICIEETIVFVPKLEYYL